MLVGVFLVTGLLRWSILFWGSSIPIILWVNLRWVFSLPQWWCWVGRCYLLIQIFVPRVLAGYIPIQVLWALTPMYIMVHQWLSLVSPWVEIVFPWAVKLPF